MKYNVLIGGSAGQGMDTLSVIFEKFLQREGYYLLSNKDYMSRIRGGHNFVQIRFGTEEVLSHDEKIDVIVALDKNTVVEHIGNLNEDGYILLDEAIDIQDNRCIFLPINSITKKLSNKKAITSSYLGALIKLFGLKKEKAEEVLVEKLKTFAPENIEAFGMGYDLIESKLEVEKGNFFDSIMINGNSAIAMGAIAGGVSFYSAYPMTPSTSIMNFIASNEEETGIIVEQAEDEIAAINMAIGASYAGVRAMTGTSGGGYSLMTEALGLAGITETPLVVVNVQRPGPATGLPTRTEQSDLSFILSASHGEIPRMVMSVRDPEDAFYQTFRALNLADKYQILVNVLNDQYLADYNKTIKEYDFDNLLIERYIDESIPKEEYKRYKLTESGISPRRIPGNQYGESVLADSDEHDEYGHITESSKVRVSMMDKRMNKLQLLKEDIIEPGFIGDENLEYLLIGWGSTYGAIKEAVNELNKDGVKVGALVFGDIYPLPINNLSKYSKLAKKIINVEQNYTGQLGKLIRMETSIKMDESILKYDGRQISFREIVERFKKEVL